MIKSNNEKENIKKYICKIRFYLVANIEIVAYCELEAALTVQDQNIDKLISEVKCPTYILVIAWKQS